MAQRVAAVFRSRDDAERAADALADLGADRGHISMMARGEDGVITTAPSTVGHESEGVVEPAREVGDSGAPLTTSDGGDAAKGAAIGAVAGLAAGLLALTVPGIGLVLAAGPLAAAIASGAVAGGVYGGLRDIGIAEHHARSYEERIRGGSVLLTGLIPNLGQQQVRDVLTEHGAEDISFTEDTSVAATTASAAAATAGMANSMSGTRTIPTPGEVRVPVTEETAEVRKQEREVGQVGIRKEVDIETQHISEPVTETKVHVERHPVTDGGYAVDPNAAVLREGETLRVPVVKEELKVEKVPRVTEEVVVRAVRETEQVERDVELRNERVEVDEEGDTDVENVDNVASRPNP